MSGVDDKPMIEAVDCYGALGIVMHRRPPGSGRALAAAILDAARQQTPNLVHPEATVGG